MTKPSKPAAKALSDLTKRDLVRVDTVPFYKACEGKTDAKAPWKACGVSESTYGRISGGKHVVSFAKVMVVAENLNVDFEDLIRLDDAGHSVRHADQHDAVQITSVSRAD